MLPLVATAFALDLARGPAIAAAAGCADCHVVPGVAEPARTESCTGCHAWIRGVSANPPARAAALTLFPLWPRYEADLRSYFTVPDLRVAFARLDPAWIATYLRDPHDLRPGLDETMVRVGLDAASLDTLAAWAGTFLVPVAPSPAPSSANVAQGERLFAERGCGACHDFGARVTTGANPAAPDLRWARDRMSDDRLVAWIEDPTALAPTTTMPRLGLGHDEAVALRDYLVLADPGGTTASSRAVAAAPPTAPTWDDVESRVFGKTCVHCHMDPAQNEGRAGPGNAGGFGWAATGIELQTYEGVRDHRDRVLAALRRRSTEEARDHVAPGQVPATVVRPELPGMPLGLPALSADDLALVEAWYAAGAPR